MLTYRGIFILIIWLIVFSFYFYIGEKGALAAIVLLYAINIFSYIYWLILLSKELSANFPDLHKKYKGVSSFKGVEIISPILVFSKENPSHLSSKARKAFENLKYSILALGLNFFLVLSFIIFITNGNVHG